MTVTQAISWIEEEIDRAEKVLKRLKDLKLLIRDNIVGNMEPAPDGKAQGCDDKPLSQIAYEAFATSAGFREKWDDIHRYPDYIKSWERVARALETRLTPDRSEDKGEQEKPAK